MVSKIEHKNRTGCPVACALDIVGDHWTLLIIRNLMFSGRHEYKDMLGAEEQISSSMLSARLKKLELDGLIASTPHPDSQRRKLYYLTPMGKDLIHVMLELMLWSDRHLNDLLSIPEQKRAALQDAAGFKAQVLRQLEQWEQRHLPGF